MCTHVRHILIFPPLFQSVVCVDDLVLLPDGVEYKPILDNEVGLEEVVPHFTGCVGSPIYHFLFLVNFCLSFHMYVPVQFLDSSGVALLLQDKAYI